MSWFNNSLNSIKGQLSNLADGVMSDVYREEEAISPVEALQKAQDQCEQLSQICTERDNEIATLRKKVLELEVKAAEATPSAGTTGASPSANIDAPSTSNGLKNVSLEDSWYWADNSSENENGKHLPQNGLLDKIQKENQSLNEEILKLREENRQLNANLEELDDEHQIAIQKVLEVKTELQQKYGSLSKDYESLKVAHAERMTQSEKKITALRQKFENLRTSYSNCSEENLQLKDHIKQLTVDMANKQEDSQNLQSLLAKKDRDISELVEKINEKSESENEQKSSLEERISELTKELEILRSTHDSAKPEKKLSESSSGKQSVDDDFIVVPVLDSDSPLPASGNKEELEEKINQLGNRIAELVLENGTYQSRIQDLEMEKTLSVSQLERSVDELQKKVESSEKEIQTLQERVTQLSSEKQQIEDELVGQKLLTDKLTKENQTLKIEMETINDNMNKCEANASDVESKLMMENVDLQKKLIDLESSLNKNSTNSGHSVDVNFIKSLFSTYTRIELPEANGDSIESAFKKIRDKIWQIEVLEKNLAQISEEILDLQENKLSWDHEKKTLEADISQYIIQCDELMKNNEILLNELENYKHNKLETISENNEENLLLLETQLDECRSLNTTLEEEYREMNDKISELENEKHELMNQLKSVQDINSTMTAAQKELQVQVDALEQEKSDLLFEVNEMKSGDKENESDHQLSQLKVQCEDLKNQLARVNADLADAVSSLQALTTSLQDTKKEKEQLEQEHRLKDVALAKMDAKIKELLGTDERYTSEVESIKSENVLLQQKVDLLSQEKTACLEKINKLEEDLLKKTDFEKALEYVNFEKNELIKKLEAKHAENVRYYMEIEDLGNRLHTTLQEKAQLTNQCTTLETTITDNKTKIEKLEDQIVFLKEKSDIMTNNLLAEQSNQRLVHQQRDELVEMNENLQKDLDRLRQHLVELEESHTQETIEMQSVIDETKAQMSMLQEEVSKSSNAYTSASIRANQHAETLQAQYALVTQQRDELVAKLSLAEDRESKNQAALVNLQCALEQFQNDKDHEIKLATQKLQRELQSEHEKHAKLEADIAALNQQLAEANQGLRAATRLSDLLETSQMTIASLNEEVQKLMEKNTSLSEELKMTESSQTDKIEKNLIKSLVIGYVVSGNINDKNQVLRMISSVLDFTQAETNRVGLNKQQTNWLGSIIPPIPGVQTKDSLVQAFVHFLEQESQPRSKSGNMPNLLNITSQSTTSSTSTGSPTASTASRKSSHSDPATKSTAGTVQPILLNTTVLDDFAPSRNSSSILKDILSDS